MNIATLIGTVSGLGHFRHGGIAAALIAVPLVWGLHWIGGFPLVILGTLSAAGKTLWAQGRCDGPLVSDRLAGQMLALWALSGGLWFAGVAPHVFPYPGWIGALLLCQGLLWWRPAPVRRAARIGPLWDDVAAGAVAALVTLVSAAISHGWLS